jgi:hypothetical protein
MSHNRRFRIFGSLLALCLCAGTLRAATPYVAAVVQADAEIRCKPSLKPELYATNRLPQGSRVLVLEERSDGWLGIQPPPGSFSWINASQVERIVPTQSNWVVMNDNVPVLIGSELVRQRPTVEGIRLARGTQVRVIGHPEKDGTTAWLPIDPPAGEIRYVRVEAVRSVLAAQPSVMPANPPVMQPKPVESFAAVRTSASPGSGDTPTTAALAIPTPSAVAPPSANASAWDKVRYLEQQGRWDDAVRMYDQLAHDLQHTNTDWANFAAQRAAWLRSGHHDVLSLPATQPASYSTFQPEARPSSPTVQPPPPSSARLSVPPEAASANTASPPNQTASWSSPQASTAGLLSKGPGRLVRSYFKVNGAPVYRLETLDGFVYVAAAPGIELESSVDHNVTVFGTTQYSPEMRVYYMVVSRVQPA